MVPAGWPAPASPKQVPEPGDVLGARANRPSLAWSRSLGFHAERPLRASPASATLKGTIHDSSLLRSIARENQRQICTNL